jgi:hypothetical protein
MDRRLSEWKSSVERLCSAPVFDHREAAKIVAEIAREAEELTLQQKATQALPSLRAASAKGADQWSRGVARRRFALVRDCLHALAAPRFGKRRADAAPPSIDEHYRRILGLPLGRRLFGPEIKDAYKRAAKKMHPDRGGSDRAFHELSAARDALMKSL